MGGKHRKRKGEALQYDPEFAGPLKNRSCTDIICLLLFLAFLGGWIVVAVFAVQGGDPERLLHPTDSEGRVCGRGEFANKTNLFFFDLTRCASPKVLATGCPTPQVCVSECPSENWFYKRSGSDPSKLICRENINTEGIDSNKAGELVWNGDCAYYYVESRSLGHRCIPKDIFSNIDTIISALEASLTSPNSTTINKWVVLTKMMDAMKYVGRFARLQKVAEGVFQDVQAGWWVLLAGFGIAMVISFLWILLLRFISGVMIWFSIVAFILLSGFGSYYTLNKYLTLRGNSNATLTDMTNVEQEFSLNFSRYAELETTWLVLFIITLIILVVCLFVLIFLRKRITIAISLIGQASKAVGSIMSTLFFPIVPYILQLIFLTFFCVVAVFLASAGKADYRIMCSGDENCGGCTAYKENETCSMDNFDANLCKNVTCQFFDYVADSKVPWFHVYNVFALFWSMFFVSAFGEMVLAGAFASWYWVFDKSRVPTFAVTMSLGRTLRYHTGTLAFGSLIIAIVRMIRVILEYIDHKVKEKTDSKVVRALLCCCRCCLWCLEKFLKFINRNAYVYCAIYGKNFCVSAKNAFSLIMRNIVRVVVLDKVTDFLLFIGKMVVVGAVGVASFFIFSGEVPGIGKYLPNMNYYLTPVIIITIGTFFIASAFFDVYAMAVDTLFLCFLEDCERNDGSAEKPYFMSKDLMRILNKKNKDKDKEE